MQLFRSQLKPLDSCAKDYKSLSRYLLIDLIVEKDNEIAHLKAKCEFLLGQTEVELSFARSKLVQLVDSAFALDREVSELRDLTQTLRQQLEESEAKHQILQRKYKESARDARQHQQLLNEYEANDEERLLELEDKDEAIKALERTLEEEIIYTDELKATNRDLHVKIKELESLLEAREFEGI